MLRILSREDLQAKVLRTGKPFVVLFTTTWCPFCRCFEPVYKAYASRSRLDFAAVYLDELESPLWNEYHIDVVPTIAFFNEGEILKRIDGIPGVGLSENDLSSFLNSLGNRRPSSFDSNYSN